MSLNTNDWIDSVQFLNNLHEIPERHQLGLFGDCQIANYLIDILDEERPDVSVDFVVTTSKDGTFRGRPMITATSFLDSPPSFDMLIITPLFCVEDILKTIKNVTQEKIYVNAIVDCTSLIKRNQYKTFEPVDLGSDEIIKMFYDKESRDQWRELIQAMKTRNIISCFKRFHKEKDLKKLQYMEYSFLRSGDTVIEGGIFTGNTTSRFSNIVGMGWFTLLTP